MKMHQPFLLLASVLLSFIPFSVLANWQVSSSNAASVPREPFFQTGRTPQPNYNYKDTSVTYAEPKISSKRHHGIRKTYSSYLRPAPISPYQRHHAFVAPSAPVYAVSISGSLKENLERIMGRYQWKVIWKAPYDYNFDGRVTGTSLANVVGKLLQPFPLQAQMYMSNRTLAVVARNQ